MTLRESSSRGMTEAENRLEGTQEGEHFSRGKMGEGLVRQGLERGPTGGFLPWDRLEHVDWQGLQ